MAPRTLTVLAAIRPGEEKRLRDVLRPIGDDIKGKRLDQAVGRPHIDFTVSRFIHFARFAILADPDRGAERKRLLYSANYDGELDDHLAELTAITSDMEAIWGRCDAYTREGDFGSFIRTHALEPEAFYIAFRDESVERIQNAVARRRAMQALGNVPTMRRELRNIGQAIAERVGRLIRALPIGADLFRIIARCGVTNVVRGTLGIIASLDRIPLFRWLNRLTDNRMPPRQSAYSSVGLDTCAVLAPLAPGDEVPTEPNRPVLSTFREDVVTQNQLTLVTVVKPGHVDRVRAVMAAIDSYAKRLAPPGSLIGVSTIHFVKWLVIDEGRRLMLVSDYDGSWESYIDEFAEMILSGLDAIWETAYGYPPDGARDVPALKWFLRSHQVPSEIFFSAYPEETVVNIVTDQL